MPKINLRAKLLAIFLTINLVSILSLSVVSNQVTTNALKEDVGANLKSLAHSEALTIGSLLARQIDALLSLSTNRVLQDRALNASNSYSGDQAEILAKLLTKNEQWHEAADADLLVQNILKNTSATELLNFQELFPDFVEVMITDNYGGLTAATNRTSDYYQSDEDWWQTAYNGSDGALYLSQPVFDESSETLGVDIVVPLHANHSESVVGVLKATYQFTRFSQLLAASNSQQRGLQMYLLFSNDNLLTNAEYMANLDPITVSQLRATADQPYAEFSLFGKPGLVSQAQIQAITGETLINDLGWHVVVYQEREAALDPVSDQQRLMLVLSIITMVSAALTVSWFAQFLTRPIRHLTETIQQVRQGNSQARASINSTDEIGQLALAFNDMTSQLNTSIEALKQEIVERKRTEHELAHYRNHLEDLVEQRTTALTLANAELKKLSQAKDEFVSNVSHELKSPIASFTLRHYLLHQKPEQLEKHLSVLERETARLNQTIEDLLRLSRLDQDRTEVVLGPVDLNITMENFVQDRALLAQQKELTLTFAEQTNVPVILADQGLIEQVISILITNAINYTPAQGQISVSTQIEQRGTQYWVGFSVQDTGLGILPEEQPQLFERFFQGAASQQSKVPGTGLGLAIAKEIIDLHQGQISVESTGIPGTGTTFRVWLPVEEEANNDAQISIYP